MADKIINSEDEFETIDLDLDDSKPDKMNDESEEDGNEIESLDDLNLDALEEGSKGEVVDEFANQVDQQKPETKQIAIEQTKPITKTTVSKGASIPEDLEIDLDDAPSTPVNTTVTVSNTTATPPTKDDDLGDLNLDDAPVVPGTEELTLPPVAPPPEKVKGKRGRKPKAQVEAQVSAEPYSDPSIVTTIEETVEPAKDVVISESNMLLDPAFDITLISDSNKYQTRMVQRTQQQLEDFGKVIAIQGQLEPIHIHKEGSEYFVVVGFGRLASMKLIGCKTIKVIIHENLDSNEIAKLSTGTNEYRLQLSEWDKIASVGIFHQQHPEVTKDHEEGKTSLTSIFGYARASIYNYLAYYKFFHDKEKFCNLFKTVPVPQFVFKVLLDAQKHITDDEKFIKFILDNMSSPKKTFETELATFIAQEKHAENIANSEGGSLEGLDEKDGPGDKDGKDVDSMVKTLTEKEGKPSKEVVEIIKKVSELFTELTANIALVEGSFKNILAIENAKLHIDNSRISSLTKKFTNLQKMYLKLV